MKRIKLGFLTVHGDTENQSQMMNGVFEAAKKYNAYVIRFAIKCFDEDINKFNLELNNLYDIIEAQKLDGIMFLGWMPGLAGKFFNNFLNRFNPIPIVSLGTKYENVFNVYADPEKCIRELMEQMINVHGYKSIVFVPPSVPDIRNAVYTETMQKYGLYNSDLILREEILNCIPIEERMQKVLSVLINERKVKFDAILVMYDIDAQNLLKELKIRKINVPDDLAIASYENTRFSSYSLPSLTTITYPWREVGFYGCEKLIKLINNEPTEHSTAILSKLIIRNSCGCCSNCIKLSKIEERQKLNKPIEKFDYKNILEFSNEIIKAFPYIQINIDKLLHALVKDFEEKSTTVFLAEFEHQLQEIVSECPYLDTIDETEELIYYLRNLLVSYMRDKTDAFILFEDIIHKAQVIIKEKAIAIIGIGQVQTETINQQLHYVSQSLIDSLSIKELFNALEKSLPNLEIPSCYIFLFNKGTLKESTMIFKYVNYKRIIIDNSHDNSTYISDEIIEKHKKVLCQLLYVKNDFLGFIVFEPSIIDERIYHSLSLHISSALKGVILLEKLTQEIALRKEKENQLTYIVNYDSLTNLFNRRYFYEVINYIIDKSAELPAQKQSFFLLFIDIDGFKQVNDCLGHDIGDVLLIQVAKRLQALLMNKSYLIPQAFHDNAECNMQDSIFRLGGDEFTAIVAGISAEEMRKSAEELINLIKFPYFINEHKVNISCSMGISIYPDNADNAEMIIKYADTAMYRAKEQKGRYYFYDDTM